jgi:hypothetical protein
LSVSEVKQKTARVGSVYSAAQLLGDGEDKGGLGRVACGQRGGGDEAQGEGFGGRMDVFVFHDVSSWLLIQLVVSCS